jgi:hypothetical protein
MPVEPVVEPVVENTESTLPQPTAPFASPRPTNLGENALHPVDITDTAAPADAAAPSLSGFNTPAEPSVAPLPVDSVDTTAPVSGLGFEATPVTPAPSVDVTPSTTPETPVMPSVTPDLTSPIEEKKDETTPPVSPTTPAV